jgi:hypothetical protein
MGTVKNPWDDVPIEVLIEYDRKKREELQERREQLRIPIYSPSSPQQHISEQEVEEDYKITIDFI